MSRVVYNQNESILPASASLQTKVIHVVPNAFTAEDGVLGGAERYAVELARHMARETPTTLVTFGDVERHETIGRLKVRVIGNPHYVRGQRYNPFSLRLLGELRDADIVHCHQLRIVSSTFAALFCRLSGRRVFVSDLAGTGWDISAYISTDRLYEGHLHISEFSKRVCGHGDKPWAHVIMGGVDTEKFSPDEAAIKENTILFVGRLVPHKGINYLIEALPEGMALEIIGQPYDTDYFELLKRLAHGKNVIFRHGCDDTALVEAYRRAICLVLPSVHKTVFGQTTAIPELLGQTLLEGMSCGTPAICTNVGSMPEIVQDSITGFVVAPNSPEALREKLLCLQHQPERARAMGLAARGLILEKFTWPKVVRQCFDIYGVPVLAASSTAGSPMHNQAAQTAG